MLGIKEKIIELCSFFLLFILTIWNSALLPLILFAPSSPLSLFLSTSWLADNLTWKWTSSFKNQRALCAWWSCWTSASPTVRPRSGASSPPSSRRASATCRHAQMWGSSSRCSSVYPPLIAWSQVPRPKHFLLLNCTEINSIFFFCFHFDLCVERGKKQKDVPSPWISRVYKWIKQVDKFLQLHSTVLHTLMNYWVRKQSSCISLEFQSSLLPIICKLVQINPAVFSPVNSCQWEQRWPRGFVQSSKDDAV